MVRHRQGVAPSRGFRFRPVMFFLCVFGGKPFAFFFAEFPLVCEEVCLWTVAARCVLYLAYFPCVRARVILSLILALFFVAR